MNPKNYKTIRIGNTRSINYVEYEIKVDKIEHHQVKSILIKLDHILIT